MASQGTRTLVLTAVDTSDLASRTNYTRADRTEGNNIFVSIPWKRIIINGAV